MKSLSLGEQQSQTDRKVAEKLRVLAMTNDEKAIYDA